MSKQPIPAILDTDIGTDIDDVWALAMLLRSPELDLKLVTVATDPPGPRAQIVAKLMTIAGNDHVPLALGVPGVAQDLHHYDAWAREVDLETYRGGCDADGPGRIIDTIMNSPGLVTVIGIGPLPNVAEALRREPRIASNARFVGMHGSVWRGYNGSAEVSAEWNVIKDSASCRKTFAAPWDVTITPLDTCGIIQLSGDRYAAIRASTQPLTQAVIECYDMWRNGRSDEGKTSILFDTVAVYLAFSEELLTMKQTGIDVTDDGFTRPVASGKLINVAADWKNLEAFANLLTSRLA